MTAEDRKNRRPRDFSHIRRMRDNRFPHEVAVIMPGEYFVSQDPMVVHTLLGSCVSACIRDPQVGIGGMNHFMLPQKRHHGGQECWGDSARYGSYAMEVLINEILKRGGHRKRLEVKVFGGGKIYDGKVDIGATNAAWVIHYLEVEGLKPVQADLGGTNPRKLYYFTASGRVLVKKIERLTDQTLFEEEERYQAALRKRREDGNVTLF